MLFSSVGCASMSTVEVSDERERRMIYVCFRRGIPAQPILNGYCGSYDMGMPRSMINYPAFNYENPAWNTSTTTAVTMSSTTTTVTISSISTTVTTSSTQETSFNTDTTSSGTPTYRANCILYTMLFIFFLIY